MLSHLLDKELFTSAFNIFKSLTNMIRNKIKMLLSVNVCSRATTTHQVTRNSSKLQMASSSTALWAHSEMKCLKHSSLFYTVFFYIPHYCYYFTLLLRVMVYLSLSPKALPTLCIHQQRMPQDSGKRPAAFMEAGR